MFLEPFLLFCRLFIGHAIGDFPWQGDFLARAKNGAVPDMNPLLALVYHCAIQAGLVWIFTGRPLLALAEFLMHLFIDSIKIKGLISFNVDQLLHILCKVAWVALIYYRVA